MQRLQMFESVQSFNSFELVQLEEKLPNFCVLLQISYLVESLVVKVQPPVELGAITELLLLDAEADCFSRHPHRCLIWREFCH